MEPSPLLSLPQEVLDQIWSYVAREVVLLHHARSNRSTQTSADTTHSLLLICKTQHRACQQALQQHATVLIRQPETLCEMFSECTGMSEIRNVTLEVSTWTWVIGLLRVDLTLIKELLLRLPNLSRLCLHFHDNWLRGSDAEPVIPEAVIAKMRQWLEISLPGSETTQPELLMESSDYWPPERLLRWIVEILTLPAFAQQQTPTVTANLFQCQFSQRHAHPRTVHHDDLLLSLDLNIGKTAREEALEIYRGNGFSECWPFVPPSGELCQERNHDDGFYHFYLRARAYLGRDLTPHERFTLHSTLLEGLDTLHTHTDPDLALLGAWEQYSCQCVRGTVFSPTNARIFFVDLSRDKPLRPFFDGEQAARRLLTTRLEELPRSWKQDFAEFWEEHEPPAAANDWLLYLAELMLALKGSVDCSDWSRIYELVYLRDFRSYEDDGPAESDSSSETEWDEPDGDVDQ